MPQFLSGEAQSLLRALFKRNPANRLGAYTVTTHMQTHKTFALVCACMCAGMRVCYVTVSQVSLCSTCLSVFTPASESPTANHKLISCYLCFNIMH